MKRLVAALAAVFASEHALVQVGGCQYICTGDRTIFGKADVLLSNGKSEDTGYNQTACGEDPTHHFHPIDIDSLNGLGRGPFPLQPAAHIIAPL